MKGIFIFFLSLSLYTSVEAYGKKAESVVSIQELEATCSKLQHSLSNNKAEIKTFEERLINFEVMMEQLRDEVVAFNQVNKESLNTRSQSLELRMAHLEQSNKALVSDMKQLSHFATETSTALKVCQNKLSELDQAIALQNKNFSNLQNAVSALIEAMQGKNQDLGVSYTVKMGDSLEKIAKNHQTSVQAIKNFNGLMTDKIIVGKTIKIPSKP